MENILTIVLFTDEDIIDQLKNKEYLIYSIWKNGDSQFSLIYKKFRK